MKQSNSFQTGDVLSHFRLLEKRDLPEYKATGYLFAHQRTGMEVCCIENDDIEQFFSFLVRTIPEDSTGAAHILEHSTLSGSSHYPVHDPFMMLDKSSVNTYMNAMTYPDKTLFLASSPLLKDFDMIFSVNGDALFQPLLRKETFEQEGVRLVDDGKGGHWEGVVFNEMLGASSDHDNILVHGVVHSLFEGSCYCNESGGEPSSIVTLTYEQYKVFYQKWYHPSNVKLFVYGANDVPALLEQLDTSWLSSFGRGAAIPVPSIPKEMVRDGRAVYHSPKEAEGREDGLSIVLSWAMGESSDPKEVATLDALVDMLLDDPSCPLYKALLDSGLGEDISPESGMISDFPSLVFLVGFKGIKAGMEDQVEQLILSSLADIVKKGIGQEAIASTMKNSRFKQQEIPGSAPEGLRILGRSVHGWMQGKGPFQTISVASSLQALDESLKEDPLYFEHWIQTNLLDNHHRVLVSVVPTEDFLPSQQKALRLAASVALHAEVKEENARFNLFENTPDDKSVVASLPHLTLQDLPHAIRPNGACLEMVGDTPVYRIERFTNGIVYVNLFCAIDDFSVQEVKDLTLFTRQVMTTGVGPMDERSVALKLKRLFGDFSVSTDNGLDIKTGKPRLYFTVRMKMLKEDVSEALDFASGLLLSANITDEKRLKIALTDLKGDFVDSITYNANAFSSMHASSLLSPSMWDSELLQGMEQWFSLASLTDADVPAVGERFRLLQKKLANRNRFSLSFCADDGSAFSEIGRFLSTFPAFAVDGKGRAFVRSGERHLFIAYALPSSVSYCAKVFRASAPDEKEQVAELLLGQMLTTNELWSVVRMKGGAYGVDAHADMEERLFAFSSYRDPRISGTFKDFRKVLEQYAKGEVAEEEITNAMISFIGTELRPLGPSQECVWSSKLLLYHYDDMLRSKRREWLLSCSKEDIVGAAKRLLEFEEQQESEVVFCSSSMLKRDGYAVHPIPLPL